jgi:molecular chaperone GrpE
MEPRKENNRPSPASDPTHETQVESDPSEDAREEVGARMSGEAADIALAAVDELAERAAEAEQLRGELQATHDKLLRQAAEYQNYRRRTEQEKSGLVELGQVLVLQRVLDILDDFGRALEAAEQVEHGQADQACRTLRQGMDLVYRKFVDEMARLGVTPIDAVGKPFSEQEHEAMMQQPASDGTPAGIVLGEIQKGYRLGDRVLRHSKVIVSG